VLDLEIVKSGNRNGKHRHPRQMDPTGRLAGWPGRLTAAGRRRYSYQPHDASG
jgi:hypothetical protein